MSVEEYFSIMIWVLMGLTFIALSLIFLYLIYGKKEEASPDMTKMATATNLILKLTDKMHFLI
jgi:hypothetical protein